MAILSNSWRKLFCVDVYEPVKHCLLGFALAISRANWEEVEDREDTELYQHKTSFNTNFHLHLQWNNGCSVILQQHYVSISVFSILSEKRCLICGGRAQLQPI